jgi:hypothetical protein
MFHHLPKRFLAFAASLEKVESAIAKSLRRQVSAM